MHTFFHGWRRKTGMVAMVIFTSCWIASFYRESRFQSPYFCEVEMTAISRNGRLQIEVWRYGVQGATRTTYPLKDWRAGWFGVQNASGVIMTKADLIRIDGYLLPYWIIAVPLAPLSAYLILWKPRKQSRDRPIEV